MIPQSDRNDAETELMRLLGTTWGTEVLVLCDDNLAVILSSIEPCFISVEDVNDVST